MKHSEIDETEEYFLEFLLHSYSQKDKILSDLIVNENKLQAAVRAFFKHFI